MTLTVEIVGGMHDGAQYELPHFPHQKELRLPRLSPPKYGLSPIEPLAFDVEVYGPATEADFLLGRWSLLRVEKP